MSAAASPFRSFWMGGFEGADHLNSRAVPLDMAHCSGHLARLDEDYARAAALGLRTVRESIGWRLAEPQPGHFDFTRLRRMAEAARRHGLQVLWTLMHYGTPSDVSLMDDAMIERFACFAAAVARTLESVSEEPPVYNLINEIGFLAWAVSATGLVHPYCNDPAQTSASEAVQARAVDDGETVGDPDGAGSTESSGYEVKRRLARAVLAGIDAVRRVDPRARFLHIEPVVHVTVPRGRADLQPLAERVGAFQWQAWDLIAGRVEPGLGGHPAALDLIGVNHYHSGQWEVQTEARLWWHLRDPRRRALAALLDDVWQRYRRPLIVAETGHVGSGRAAWLHEVASEVGAARRNGVPVGGICLYPLIDRPDWNDATHWHHSGLWDVDPDDPGPGARTTTRAEEPHGAQPARWRRRLHLEYAEALAAWQRRLPHDPAAAARRPVLLAFAPRRWGATRGRLQQLMLQLARHYRVLIVEPPLGGDPIGATSAGTPGAVDAKDATQESDAVDAADAENAVEILRRSAEEPRLDRIVQGPGIEVLVPRIPRGTAGRGVAAAERLAIAGALLGEFLRREAIDEVRVWLASASVLPLPGHVRARRIVFDCNDAAGLGATDFSATGFGATGFDAAGFSRTGFSAAVRTAAGEAPQGSQHLAATLTLADLVLTGAPDLHAPLRRLHANVHWLPDAVDAGRFCPAGLDADTEEAESTRQIQRAIGHPRLGWFGRIDDRLDFALIASLADRCPDVHLVMVGPLDGIDEARLPRRGNLHWLGPQPYDRMPYFAASWDVCLLPLRACAATRHGSPSQVLEYLAAGKPVVGSTLLGLARRYAALIRVADGTDAFVRACRAALDEDAAARRERSRGVRALLAGVSWERSAERVRGLLERPAPAPAPVTAPARWPAGSYAPPVAAAPP